MKFFSQGKTCFHYMDPSNENTVSCNENRFFPVRKTSQGKPFFHYRDGFAVRSPCAKNEAWSAELGLRDDFNLHNSTCSGLKKSSPNLSKKDYNIGF